MTKKSRFPDSLVLIFAMIVLAQIATLVLPKGEFARDGRKVLEGTYAPIEETVDEDAGFLDTTVGKVLWILPASLLSIPKGLEASADIIFFVFLVGGVIAVIRRSGAIDALLATSIRAFGDTPLLLIAGMTTVFAIGSSTIGMAEEYMPFIPVLVTMALAMKMDAVVALAIVYIGAGVGYGCAAANPFTVLIAQGIAELDPYSGWEVRSLLLVVCLAVGVHHVMGYVKRISADPSRSLVADVDYTQGFDAPEDVQMTGARLTTLLSFLPMLALFVYGASDASGWGWYFHELAALFLVWGILAAILAKISANEMAREFCKGAAEMTTTALLIGFARTIEVILSEGQVIDTVINGIAQPLSQAGSTLAAIGMFLVQSVCNFFIPSGSGQAYVTMPIMAPLSDLTGVSRQTAVLSYQLGDGFMNMIVPTNALLMGMLGLAKIPYERWFRFIAPLLVKLAVVAAIALSVAVAIEF